MSLFKTVSDFTGDGYSKVKKMICDEFMLIYKHAIISNLMKTEDGIEILKRADRLNKTEPDVNKLRNLFGKGA